MEPYTGEIRIFAGKFAPRHWAFCDGQLLQISQHPDLYSLLGTRYGGDGRVSFGLPDMRGRIPIHQGQGRGLTERKMGMKGGFERVTLSIDQMPEHSHSLVGVQKQATNVSPAQMMYAEPADTTDFLYNPGTDSIAVKQMNENIISDNGAGQSHENEMPYICVNYMISLFGIYPPRS